MHALLRRAYAKRRSEAPARGLKAVLPGLQGGYLGAGQLSVKRCEGCQASREALASLKADYAKHRLRVGQFALEGPHV